MSLCVENLSFCYGRRKILDKVSFEQKSGKILALLGPNGTGKTTLMKSMSGIMHPLEGRSLLDGENILEMNLKKRAKLVAYVPQNTNTAFPVRVVDAVMMGRKPFQNFCASREDEKRVFELLEEMELMPFAFKYTNELSGGERQRVFLARALCQEPKLLLLDEPTSSMDLKNQLKTMSMIRKLADGKNLTIVVAIHDINLAAMYCDDFMMLCNQQIFTSGDAQKVLTEANMEMVYGVKADLQMYDGYRHVVLKKL
jgi:iron complex transport system ATP-binding protein